MLGFYGRRNKMKAIDAAAELRPKLNYVQLCIISTAYVAVGLSTQGFMAMLTLVRSEFAIGSAQAGLYTTFFFLSATAIAIFSGRLADSLGSKRGLVLGTLAVGVLMVLHSVTPTFGVILILAFFSGLGFSLITPSVNKGVIEMVPPDRRAMSLGISHAGGALGGVLGASLLPYFGMLFGWRIAILIAGGIAILFSLLLQAIYKPVRSWDKQASIPKGKLKEDMKKLLGNKALLCVAMMGFLFGFTLSSVTTHLVIFLDQDIGFTPAVAGFALATLQVGGIFGQPGWGYLNDRYMGGNRRLGFLIIGILAGIFTLLLGTLVPESSGIWVFLLVFLFGITSLGIPALFFTTVGDIVSNKLMGTATGLSLIFIRLGVIIGPPLFGLLADLQGNYTASWLLLGAMLIGVTGLFYGLSARHFKLEEMSSW
jgi:predicted MFS family arabinose efflux permease